MVLPRVPHLSIIYDDQRDFALEINAVLTDFDKDFLPMIKKVS